MKSKKTKTHSRFGEAGPRSSAKGNLLSVEDAAKRAGKDDFLQNVKRAMIPRLLKKGLLHGKVEKKQQFVADDEALVVGERVADLACRRPCPGGKGGSCGTQGAFGSREQSPHVLEKVGMMAEALAEGLDDEEAFMQHMRSGIWNQAEAVLASGKF